MDLIVSFCLWNPAFHVPGGVEHKLCYLPEENHTDVVQLRGYRFPWPDRDLSQQTSSCRAGYTTRMAKWGPRFQPPAEPEQTALHVLSPCLWWGLELVAVEMLQGSHSFIAGLSSASLWIWLSEVYHPAYKTCSHSVLFRLSTRWACQGQIMLLINTGTVFIREFPPNLAVSWCCCDGMWSNNTICATSPASDSPFWRLATFPSNP